MTKAALADVARASPSIMEQRAAEQERARQRRRSSSTGSTAAGGGGASDASSESAASTPAATSSSARSAAAARRAAVATDHPPDACRYPNKRCFNKRAVKNNGQLHKFCEAHRDSANQYQRRLEQRLKQKRIQSRLKSLQAQREQAAAMVAVAVPGGVVAGPAGVAVGSTPRVAAPIASGTQNVLAVHYAVNQGVAPGLLRSRSVGANPLGATSFAPTAAHGAVQTSMALVTTTDARPVPLVSATGVATPAAVPEFEPFQYPVSLEDEDIQCLYDLFLEP
jgi:hypothetical protein